MLGGIIELEARLSLVKLQQDIAKLEKVLDSSSIKKLNTKITENFTDALDGIKESVPKIDDIELPPVEMQPSIEPELNESTLPNLDEIKASLEKIYNLPPLIVTVDDTALTKLNEHIDLKKEHWANLIAYYNSNPLIANTQNLEPVGVQKKDDNNDINGLSSPVNLPKNPNTDNTGAQAEVEPTLKKNNFNPFTQEFTRFVEEQVALVEEQVSSAEKESEGVDIFRTAIESLKTTFDKAFTTFNDSIRIFIEGVEEFKKGQKKGFFKSIFSGIGNFLGQSIGQFIAFKISDIFIKKIASIGTSNKIAEKAVADVLTLGAAFVISTEAIEKVFLATSLTSSALQAITKKGLNIVKTQPESVFNQELIELLHPIDKRLEEIKEATWDTYKELAQVSLIVELLKNFKDILFQGIKRGFVYFVSSIVQKAIMIPKKMLSSGVGAVGHRVAQTSMIPFQKMFDLIATGKTGAEKNEIALRRGYIVSTLIQAAKQAPAKSFEKAKDITSTLMTSFANVVNSVKETRFGNSFLNEYEAMLTMFKESSSYVQDKFARVKSSVTSFVIKLLNIDTTRQNPFIESVKKFVANIKKVIDDPLILAEKLNNKTFEQYKEALNKAAPVTTEEILTSILEEIKAIKNILSSSLTITPQNIATTNTVDTQTVSNPISAQNEQINQFSSASSFSMSSQPITAAQLAQLLTRFVDRMRKQGSGRGKASEGGLNLLASNFTDLGLDTSGSVAEIKATLTEKLKELGDTDKIDQLQEIATFLVKNWEKLAHQNHKFYTPDISFTDPNSPQTRLFDTEAFSSNLASDTITENYQNTGDSIEQRLARLEEFTRGIGYNLQVAISEGSPGPTRNIRMHWSNTVEHIENELKTLVGTSKKQGYEVQKNISEGSPGITAKIREHWGKTFAFLVDIFKKLSGSAIALGKTFSSNLIEQSAGTFKNIFSNVTGNGEKPTNTEQATDITESSTSPLNSFKGFPQIDFSTIKEGIINQIQATQENGKNQLQNIKENINRQIESSQNVESFDLGKIVQTQLTSILNYLKTEIVEVGVAITQFSTFIKTQLLKTFATSKIKLLELSTFTNNLWQSLLQSFRQLKINLLTQLKTLNGNLKFSFDLSNVSLLVSNLTKKIEVTNENKVETSFSILWETLKIKSEKIGKEIESISIDFFSSKIVTAIQTQSNAISQSIQSFSMTSFFSSIFEEIKVKKEEFKATIKKIPILNILSKIWQNIKTFIEQLKSFINKNIFDKIKNSFTSLTTAIETNLIDFQQNITGQITRLRDKITIEKEGGKELDLFISDFIEQIKILGQSFKQNIPSIQLFDFSFLTEIETNLHGIEKNLKDFNEVLYRIFVLSDLSPELLKIETFFKQQTDRIVSLFLKKIEEAKTRIVKQFNSMLLKISNNIGLNLPIDQKLGIKIAKIIAQSILSFVTGSMKGLIVGLAKIPSNITSPVTESDRAIEKKTELENSENIFQTKVKQLIEDSISSLGQIGKEVVLVIGDFILTEIKSIKIDFSKLNSSIVALLATIFDFFDSTIQKVETIKNKFNTATTAIVKLFNTFVLNFTKFFNSLNKLPNDLSKLTAKLNPFSKNTEPKQATVDTVTDITTNNQNKQTVSNNEVTQYNESSSSSDLYTAISETLQLLNRKGKQTAFESVGQDWNPKLSTENQSELIFEAIKLDPSILTKLQQSLESNWDNLTLDINNENPLASFETTIERIEDKWETAGASTQSRIKEIAVVSKKVTPIIKRALAHGSPGLTRDIQDRWKETSASVGKEMAKMSKQGQFEFSHLSDLLMGIKVTGEEVADTYSGKIKDTFSNLVQDLKGNAEISFYELLGINLKDDTQIDDFIGNFKDKLNTLKEIQIIDIDDIIKENKTKLSTMDLLDIQESKEKISNVSKKRIEVETTLLNKPNFKRKDGTIDKKATLQYFHKLEKQLAQYASAVGNLGQHFKVNPIFQKLLEQLPTQAKRQLNSFVDEVKEGFDEAENIANTFQSNLIDTLNLKPEALRNLGVPEIVVTQVESLVEKGKTRKTSVAFDAFEMPSFDTVIAQSQRALININDVRESLNEIKKQQKTGTSTKTNLTAEIKKTFKNYQQEYKKLLEQNKITEANDLEKSFKLYQKQKALQIKEIDKQRTNNRAKLVDTSLQLKQFQNKDEVKAYLDQFKGVDQQIEALNEKLITANENFAQTVIETNNAITKAMSAYEEANTTIKELESQKTNLIQQEKKIEINFDQKRTNAINTSNLKEITRLESERERQLTRNKERQKQITQEIIKQKNVATSQKEIVFKESQRQQVIRINALYETETDDKSDEKTGFFENLKTIFANIKELGKGLFSGVLAQFEQMKQKFPILKGVEDFFKKIGLQIGLFVVAGIVGFQLLTSFLKEMTQQAMMYLAQFFRNTYNIAREVESLKAQFNFVFGDTKGLPTLKLLRKQSDDLGLSFKEMQGNFLQFTLGLKSARLDPYALELFEGVQKGLAVRGVSGEVSNRALVALTQIANKGKVSLEELNGQLGEALPGTLAVASKAMNMTSDELITMVSRGRLLSEEFLPKFLRALSTEADSAMGASLETGNAKIAQLGNTLLELQEILGKGSLEFSKPILTGLNAILKTVIQHAEIISKVIAGVILGFLYPLMVVAAGFVGNFFKKIVADVVTTMAVLKWEIASGLNLLKAKTVTLTESIKMAFNSIKVSFLSLMTTIKTALVSIAPMLIFTFAIEAISGLFAYFNNEFDRTAKKIENKLQQIKERENKKKEKEPTTLEALHRRGSGNFLGDTIDTIGRFLPKVGLKIGEKIVGVVSKPTQQRIQDVREYSSFSANAYFKESSSAAKAFMKSLDLISETEKAINKSGGLDKYIKKRTELELEFENNAAIIQGKKAIQTVEAKKEIDILRERNFALTSELSQLEKVTFASGSYEERLKEQQDLIASIEAKIESKGDPTGQLNITKQRAEEVAKTLEHQIEVIKNKVNDLKNSFGNLANELEKVDAKIQAIQFTNEVIGIEKKTTILKEQLSNKGINTPALQLKQASTDVSIVKTQLDTLKQGYAERDKVIKETKDKSSSTILLTILQEYDKNLKKLEDASLSTVMLAETTEGLEGEPKELLGLLRKHLESSKEIAQAEQNLVQSYVSLVDQERQIMTSLLGFVRSLEDFQVSVDDFYRQRSNQLVDFEFQYVTTLRDNKRNVRNLIQQYEDLRNQLDKEIQQYAGELKVALKRLNSTQAFNTLRGKLNFGAEGIFSGILDIMEAFDTSSLTYEEQMNSINQERIQIELDIISQSRQVRDLSEAIADFELQRLQTLKDLVRAQEDYVINQVNSWRGIVRQSEDMYLQAQNMGFTFTAISDLLFSAQLELANVVDKIANFQYNLSYPVNNTEDVDTNEITNSNENNAVSSRQNTSQPTKKITQQGRFFQVIVRNKQNQIVDPSQSKILEKLLIDNKTLKQLTPFNKFSSQNKKIDYYSSNPDARMNTTGTVTSVQKTQDENGYQLKMSLAEFPGYTIELKQLNQETKKIVNTLNSTKQSTQSNYPTPTKLRPLQNYEKIAANLLRSTEGFRSKAYYDHNAWRIGYGTAYKGNQSVAYNKNSTITRQQADIQLTQYDIPRFTNVIKKQIGKDWDNLTDSIKASLISIAYNKGQLTKAMVTAIKQKDMATLKQVILRTDATTHLTRRKKEASLIPQIQVTPQNQPQRLNQTPIRTTGINTKGGYTPIIHENTADVKELIQVLRNNKKLTQSQIEEALGFVAIGDTRGAMAFLTKSVANIADYKKALVDLKAKQAYQQIIKEDLAIQKQINQSKLTMEEGMRSATSSLISNRIQFMKNHIELKGFTSATDTMNISVLDAVKSHFDYSQSLETEIRNLDKLIDGTNLSNEELKAQVDAQYASGLMSKETYDAYNALIDQGFDYQTSLQKIRKEYGAMAEATAKNKDAMIAFRKEMALLDANIARSSDFSSIFNGIADIAKVAGRLDLANAFSIKGNRLDNLNRMYSIIQNIDKQLLDMKTNPSLFNPKAIQELENMREMIPGIVKIKLDKEEFDKQAEQIISQLNEFKSVFSTIGEIKNKVDFGSGNTEIYLSRIIEIKAKYVDLDKQLNNIEKNSTDAFSLSLIRDYRSQLGDLETKELKQLQFELSNVNKFVKEPLRAAFSSLLTDFVRGTKSLTEIFTDFLNGLATKLVDYWLDANIDKMLMGLMDAFGGGGDYGTANLDMGLAIAQGVIDDNTLNKGNGNAYDGSSFDINSIALTQKNFTADLSAVFDKALSDLRVIVNGNTDLSNLTSNIKSDRNSPFSSLGSLIGDSITDSLATSLNSVSGGLGSIFGNLAQQLITSVTGGITGGSNSGGWGGILGNVFSFIPKIFGFSNGGLITDTTIPNFSDGGLITQIDNFSNGGLIDVPNFTKGGLVTQIDNFTDGGKIKAPKIKNYALGGNIQSMLSLGYGVQKAMQKEGSGAVPIVANNRERVLNPTDTLIFNTLLDSGKWQQIKEERVANFNNGGLVSGFDSTISNLNNTNFHTNSTEKNERRDQKIIVDRGTTINVYAKDANSFKESQTQIAYKQNLADRRRKFLS